MGDTRLPLKALSLRAVNREGRLNCWQGKPLVARVPQVHKLSTIRFRVRLFRRGWIEVTSFGEGRDGTRGRLLLLVGGCGSWTTRQHCVKLGVGERVATRDRPCCAASGALSSFGRLVVIHCPDRG